MKAYISAIAKNEQQYIKEFVQHHLKLGFDKIIIYDNNQSNGEHYDELLASDGAYSALYKSQFKKTSEQS
jgi:hypothetical protein